MGDAETDDAAPAPPSDEAAPTPPPAAPVRTSCWVEFDAL